MIYRFADCVLDTQLYTLDRAGQSTRLAPKVFEVLCYLIEHRDRVVSKQELCDQVWEGFAISDATLESCLRAVRITVGDSGQAQRIIQTQRGLRVSLCGGRDARDVSQWDRGETLFSPYASRALEDPASTLPPSPRWYPRVLYHGSSAPLCLHASTPMTRTATFCAACGIRLRQLCAHCGQDVTSAGSVLHGLWAAACGAIAFADALAARRLLARPSASRSQCSAVPWPQPRPMERVLISMPCTACCWNSTRLRRTWCASMGGGSIL